MSPELLAGSGGIIMTIVMVVFSLCFTLAITLVTLIPFVIIFRRMYQNSAQRTKLLQSGEPAMAVIISAQQTGMLVNHNPEVLFQLEITRQDGTTYAAQSRMGVQMIHLGSIQAGNQIHVRIDPQNPQNVAIML